MSETVRRRRAATRLREPRGSHNARFGPPSNPRLCGDSSLRSASRVLREPGRAAPSSASTVDGDFERFADLVHAVVAESAQALDQRSNRDALDRVEIDDRNEWDRVVWRLEEDLGRNVADRGRARPDQGTPQARDRGVSREHDHRPAPDLRELAPPDITSRRKGRHDAPAAARNEARSPHSSASSSGCSS